MEKKVQKLHPNISIMPVRKRVAAYARVSSGKDAMLHSMSAQVSYYSDFIQRNPKWLYVGVYTDSALTGTTDNRASFQKLLTDCRDGKIDMVITKSISRFARNTVTLLETARELKGLGVDIYFEEQNIHSTSGDGELMLTILASFAQEESRSVSENCKWRIRNDFKEGKPTWFHIYGYSMVDGRLELVPDEAAVVKMIFLDYVDGMGCGLIQKKLIELNIPASQGGEWSRTAISYMLKNECYVGDLLLQKYFIKDHLSKQVVWNRGELPQYYVHGSHDAIIERDVFDKAQQIMASQTARFHPDKKAKDRYPFSGIIFCGQCGKYYRRKLTAKGTKAVWICFTFNGLGKNTARASKYQRIFLCRRQ